MITALHLLAAFGVAVALAVWGLWQGRRERQDPRQQDIHFPDTSNHVEEGESVERHRGVAMSRLSQ